MRRRVIQLYIKNNEVIFSLAWNIIFFDNFKSSCFEIFGNKEHGIFEPKSWWKYVYWLLKSSCFNLFGNGKYGLFLSQKVDGNMIFTGKSLFWTFRWLEIRSFFESRSWWKDDIYWLLRSSCFELFGDGKFLSVKKLMERWYLLGLFEFSMIIQDLGSMVFPAVLPGRIFLWK